jgi:hypothetical protein
MSGAHSLTHPNRKQAFEQGSSDVLEIENIKTLEHAMHKLYLQSLQRRSESRKSYITYCGCARYEIRNNDSVSSELAALQRKKTC